MLHVRWHSNAQMHYDVSTRSGQIMVLLSSNSLQILQFWGFSCWNCNKDPCVTNTKPYIPPTRKLNSPMRRHFFSQAKYVELRIGKFSPIKFELWNMDERVADLCYKYCKPYASSEAARQHACVTKTFMSTYRSYTTPPPLIPIKRISNNVSFALWV